MRIEFSASVDVPDGTPMTDVQEWLEFELGARCSLSGQNSLNWTDLKSQGVRYVSCSKEY